MSEQAWLPDVNVLIALANPGHSGFQSAVAWHRSIGNGRLLLCPVTEAGFVRLSVMPSVGGRSMCEALRGLTRIASLSCCAHLPIQNSWFSLIQPFASRLQGYRQVTDALLLGLAIQSGSILVTLDRRIEALAGSEFKEHLLTLQ